MRDLFGDDATSKTAIGAVAKEESRYLVHAMKILSTDPADNGLSAGQTRTVQRLQDKFGKGFEGATQLSQLLKTEAIREEFEESIKGFIGSKVKSSVGALGGANILN